MDKKAYIVKKEEMTFKSALDFIIPFINLFLNSIAYIIVLVYSVKLLLSGIDVFRFNNLTTLSAVIFMGISAAVFVYYTRPIIERNNPKYKPHFALSFLFNTIMGVSACFYIMSKINLYEIPLPSEEFLLSLYPIITSLLFVLFFPMSIIFFALPAIFLVDFFVKIKYRQQIIEDPTIVNKYLKNLGGIIIPMISIPIMIMMFQMEIIINFLIENTPYIVGSIPLYWVYLFIINPSFQILKSKFKS